MEVEETPEERHARYMDAEQGEISDPDEWADRLYGRVDPSNCDNMVAHSNDNQLRFINAPSTLRDGYNQAALQANWEEAAENSRAIAEVDALMEVA